MEVTPRRRPYCQKPPSDTPSLPLLHIHAPVLSPPLQTVEWGRGSREKSITEFLCVYVEVYSASIRLPARSVQDTITRQLEANVNSAPHAACVRLCMGACVCVFLCVSVCVCAFLCGGFKEICKPTTSAAAAVAAGVGADSVRVDKASGGDSGTGRVPRQGGFHPLHVALPPSSVAQT